MLRGRAERTLSDRFGRPVRIGGIVREGGVSLTPTIALRDVTIGQPAWVPAGTPPMAQARRIGLRLPLLPLLAGRVRPRDIAIEGLRLRLIRNAAGRANWSDGKPGGGGGANGDIGTVTIRDSLVEADDRKADRSARLALSATPAGGIALRGDGRLRGAPVTIAIRLLADARFSGDIVGPALTVHIAGRGETPYRLGRFTAHASGRGRDLRDLDTLVEAGLPATQPFQLAGDVRHAAPDWHISGLTGTIGRSTLAGDIDVKKRDGRSIIDATVHSTAADLDDLASDAQLAQAAAKRRAEGPRVVPDTRIALDKLQNTDGRIAFTIDRLLWKAPTPFRSARGTITLDRGVLKLAPVTLGLTSGTLAGSATVTQQGAHAPTRFAADLRLRGAQLQALAGGDQIAGPIEARIRFAGTGRTVRAAVAQGSGKIGVAIGGGTVKAKTAELLGRNVGRALRTKDGETMALRCLIADFRSSGGGRYVPTPMLFDAATVRADGAGLLTMADERLALTLTGHSKVPAAFRLSGPIRVTGTLSMPSIRPSPEAVSAGGVLRSIVHALTAKKEEQAIDANCGALRAAALR